MQRSEFFRDQRRAAAGGGPRGRPVRVAQEERTDCQGTKMPEQRVFGRGQDAVAPSTRRRQVQLGVPGMQEEGAGQARIVLRRLQVRAGLRAQSY